MSFAVLPFGGCGLSALSEHLGSSTFSECAGKWVAEPVIVGLQPTDLGGRTWRPEYRVSGRKARA
jgi:hypothetical protein